MLGNETHPTTNTPVQSDFPATATGTPPARHIHSHTGATIMHSHSTHMRTSRRAVSPISPNILRTYWKSFTLKSSSASNASGASDSASSATKSTANSKQPATHAHQTRTQPQARKITCYKPFCKQHACKQASNNMEANDHKRFPPPQFTYSFAILTSWDPSPCLLLLVINLINRMRSSGPLPSARWIPPFLSQCPRSPFPGWQYNHGSKYTCANSSHYLRQKHQLFLL